ncbi:MAG: ATP-binding protein [Planctomycetota bacterium]
MSPRHEPREVVEQLRIRLKQLHPSSDPERQDPVSLHECASYEQLFPASTENPVKPRRFWIPQPHACRSIAATDQEEDVRQVRLQVSDQEDATFEIQADGLVVDDRLGSLGLLQFCCPPKSGPANRLDENHVDDFVLQAVREAVGLRHELLRRQQEERSYFVELVLIVLGVERSQVSSVGQTLRNLMTRTEYLHSIGVNVLSAEAGSDNIGLSHGFAKAFSWLLPHCDAWYSDHLAQGTRGQMERDGVANEFSDSVPSLTKLQLNNFRLPGKRIWKLEKDRRLHLIHGLNGTGKSSLVESLELVMTNRIARLAKEDRESDPDYAKILTHDGVPEGQASIELEVEQSQPQLAFGKVEGQVKTNGISLNQKTSRRRGKKFDLSVQIESWQSDQTTADSFRLEQRVADLLVQSSPAERARLLLSAYFPDVDSTRTERQELIKKIETAANGAARALSLGKLREAGFAWLRSLQAGEISETLVAETLRWTARFEKRRLDWEDVLHLYTDEPEALAQSLQSVATRVIDLGRKTFAQLGKSKRRDESNLNDLSGKLLEQFDGVPTQLDEVSRAIGVIESLLNWQAVEDTVQGNVLDFTDAVDRWLCSHVQHDLAQRTSTILDTLDKLSAQNFNEPLTVCDFLQASATDNDRSRRLNELSETVERHWQDVNRIRMEEGNATTTSDRTLQVSDDDLRACDTAIDSSPQFSELVHRARVERTIQFGESDSRSFSIGAGSDAGLEAILGDLRKRQEHLRVLLPANDEESTEALEVSMVKQAGTLISRLRELRGLCVKLDQLDSQAIRLLQEQLREDAVLTCAINELTDLFTPASWAYNKIHTEGQIDSSSPRVALRNPGGEVLSNVRNTAELNTLAMVLFLLLAPRVRNPLGLLVLDDPFQNMDELTVTTVARGLARLLELWKQQDRDVYLQRLNLAVFSHSVDDVERIRFESPCHTYRLPWLSPDHTSGKGDDQAQIASGGTGYRDQVTAPNLRLAAPSRGSTTSDALTG